MAPPRIYSNRSGPPSGETLNDPIRALDLFALMEMLADWIAAADRRKNSPAMALDFMKKEYPVDAQLEAIIRNTLGLIV